jgi:hypothetical protein
MHNFSAQNATCAVLFPKCNIVFDGLSFPSVTNGATDRIRSFQNRNQARNEPQNRCITNVAQPFYLHADLLVSTRNKDQREAHDAAPGMLSDKESQSLMACASRRSKEHHGR